MTIASKQKAEYWFIFQKDLLLLTKDAAAPLITSLLVQDFQTQFLRQHTLGEFNDYNIHCAELSDSVSLPNNMVWIPLRKALELLGTDWYNIAAKAYAIINWDKTHQFCGHCGHQTMHKPLTFERVCMHCGLNFYPRISPSIIVLIHKDDEILMARSPQFTPGAYGLIAGFVEAGENIEAAVHREVFEEVGIQIKNLRYFSSQAWPFPDSLMIAFFAEYASGDLHIDSNEIETAGWYHLDNLPGRPAYRISMASKLLDHFIANYRAKKGK